MTPEQFREWRKGLGWSQAAAAEALGLSEDTIYLYERGDRPGGRAVVIPKAVRLAAVALTLGFRDYEDVADR